MTWLQFIDSMVGRLAWPIVVLILAFALRKHLGSLADRILELSFGGATVKFDKLLSKGREIIEESSSQVPLTAHERILADTMARLVEWRTSGVEGVISAYQEIERVLDDIGEQLGVKARNGILMRMLVSRGLATLEQVDLYNTLRSARNAVTHGQVYPSPLQIAEFTRQAAFLLTVLQQALTKIKDDKNK
jgi:hypothetical protein